MPRFASSLSPRTKQDQLGRRDQQSGDAALAKHGVVDAAPVPYQTKQGLRGPTEAEVTVRICAARRPRWNTRVASLNRCAQVWVRLAPWGER